MKKLIKTHHKVGLGLVALGILCFLTSFATPAISSYFIIAGIGLVLVGIFLVNPMITP